MSVLKAFSSWRAKRRRNNNVERFGVGLKCPHCECWSSDRNEAPDIRSCDHPIAVRYTCTTCSRPSYWVCEAGFWFPAEAFGITADQIEKERNK